MMLARISFAIGFGVVVGTSAGSAAPVYLNENNMTVALGASMAPEPFADHSTAQGLQRAIDAPSPEAGEFHQAGSLPTSTHIYVSGGPLELDFDFGQEYDLTAVHFWNYFSEGFDVDTIFLTFYSGSDVEVDSLDLFPETGTSAPETAEDFALSVLGVRYVNALFTGSNDQVDFNNIGFTGEPSVNGRDPIDPDPDNPEVIPLPASAILLIGACAGLAGLRRRA